ncbi:enolase [Roseomonas sp. M0104]|uniref:Enolase n=1 Tax=Teichococcus coralli TaxID=2545983 RepID=A0A845B583_9PROT|nr:mandelate racemase family protein [Pseudoroseomonas coralli]MXP62793.1 enolase [Pseudoroseomonas coralli]
MKIEHIGVRVFTHTTKKERDIDGHTHPGPARQTRSALLTITADDGSEGHVVGSPELLRPHLLDSFIRPTLLGQDPFLREKLWLALTHWQRGSTGQLTDRTVSLVELALWDLAGRKLGQPVWKLIGGYRDKVPAYGSTMCGDEIPGGLATPEDYGRFAEQLIAKGYKAIKLHTWMPPVSFAPSVAMDIKACAAVREAVGPDVPLMLDANHWYSRTEALELGRALQKLNYYWFEEPMEESSMSSYAWLAQQLDIPVIGPESAAGRGHVRGEWIRANACDILRTGVHDVGGITPALKNCHLAESFNMDCEIHGGGAGNLTVAACIANGRWYERGLLHPHYDYDEVPEYLHSLPDPMDEEGNVHLPTRPGLGEAVNLDWVREHTVSQH